MAEVIRFPGEALGLRCRPSVAFGWRRLASACLDADDAIEALSDWERRFLVDLRTRAWPPTDKQRDVLERIARSVGVPA